MNGQGKLTCARPRVGLGILLLLGGLISQVVSAGDQPAGVSFAPATPLECELITDATDGQLDAFSLVDAALIASGVTDRLEVQNWSSRLTERSAGLAPQLADLEALDQPRAIFDFLHVQLLTGKYSSKCNRLDKTLADGDYNCVSATLLYLQLCRQAGLSAVAVAAPAHVFTRFPSCQLDVETTFPRWFEVAAAERRADAESRRARYPATASSAPREMNDIQLLGKVYFNRGVGLLADGQFAAAVTCLHLAGKLDPDDPTAEVNLLAALNNWALAQGDAGDFEQATRLVEYGLSIDPQYPQLLSNDLHLHQQWALGLCKQSRHSEALAVLERGRRRRADAELFDTGRFAVYRRWVESLLLAEKVDEAFAVLTQARRQHPERAEIVAYEAAALQSAAAELARQGRADVAARIIQRGLQLQPDSQLLQATQRRLRRAPT